MPGIDLLQLSSLLVLAGGKLTCPVPDAVQINIIPQSAEVVYDSSRTLAQLQQQEIDTINPYSFGGTSVTQAFASGPISLEYDVKLGHDFLKKYGAYCLWYDVINVNIKLAPRIVIAKEVYQDRCMGKATLDHELKHVKVDRIVVNNYAQTLGKKIYDALNSRGFVAGPMRQDNVQATAERMQRTVQQIIEHEWKRLDLDRTEMQQGVDSLEEYERVSAECPDFDSGKILKKHKR